MAGLHTPATRRGFIKLSAAIGAATTLGGASATKLFAQTVEPFNAEVRTYHEVNGPQFKQDILNLLDSGAQPVSIETMVGALNGTIVIPPTIRAFHITWDDSRLSQYTQGLKAIQEIQQERGIFVPVTAFIITKFEHLTMPVEQMPDDTPTYSEDGNFVGKHQFFTKGSGHRPHPPRHLCCQPHSQPRRPAGPNNRRTGC